ncbi:MAG TPA: GNAT family N-acetyltransferase, partial [Pyrinomonadaceae bacterium]|nr:GNAT family N-acetyltransferase [Pyrinomonadaceae bacterium]
MIKMIDMIFSDRNLSQKLERTEARANASFIEARAEISPEANAEWIEVAGVYAMFDGIESPLTQTFGLGVFDEITDKELDELEAFFKKHNAPIFHEVSPLADASLIELLNNRGYQPCELTSVLYQELENKPNLLINPNIKTRIIEPDEAELWARTSADGWATEAEGLADFMFNFGKISAQTKGGFPYLAELNSQPISAGMLFIYDEIAMLAGASTVPEARGQGAQNALLNARLQFAAEKGCKIAIMGALPGSISQRNAEKNNFRIAYTRTKWRLAK